MNCKYCGSINTIQKGYLGSGNKRYKCKDCKKWGNYGKPRMTRETRILLLDIETLPGEYYAWSPKQEYLSPEMQIKDWSISCWAAKWLFESEIMGETVTPQEAVDRQDARILGGIWKLMDEAQVIVTQNGINFDFKKLNSKFRDAGFVPPSKHLNVDTLLVARAVFGETYNRLDELGKKMGIGKKTSMDFQDWKKCLTNDKSAEKALSHMLDYCKRDVAPLLEDVYLTMLPWIPNHPNLNIYSLHNNNCPKCESEDLRWGLEYPTPQGLWMGFRCNSCGSIGRGKGKEYNLRKTKIA